MVHDTARIAVVRDTEYSWRFPEWRSRVRNPPDAGPAAAPTKRMRPAGGRPQFSRFHDGEPRIRTDMKSSNFSSPVAWNAGFRSAWRHLGRQFRSAAAAPSAPECALATVLRRTGDPRRFALPGLLLDRIL
jgi:hypothetical protein